MKVCGFCEKGNLSAKVICEEFSYKGEKLRVPDYEISVCDTCGEEFVTRDQSRRNQVRLADAKRNVEGFLVSTELRRVREALGGLSQEVASNLFTGGKGSWFKYECGEVVQSTSADRLMRLVSKHPALVNELAEMAGVELICPLHGTRNRSITASENSTTFTFVCAVEKSLMANDDREHSPRLAADASFGSGWPALLSTSVM